MPSKRPLSVIIFTLLLLSVASWNGLRLGAAIAFRDILKEFYARPGALYLGLIGGLWLLTGLALAWGFWRGKVWAWRLSFGGVAGYTAWAWFDRLVLQQPHANWPYALGVTLFMLLFSTLILISRKTRLFFTGNSHDRQSENPNPAAT